MVQSESTQVVSFLVNRLESCWAQPSVISEKVEKEGTGVTKHQLEPADKSGVTPPPNYAMLLL